MSFDLKPRNRRIKGITVNAFSWPMIMQETGMGHVLGYGCGLVPSRYVYSNGNHGSPVSNDGYIVSSFEAKAMAAVALGYVSVQKFNLKEWNDLDEQTKNHQKKHRDIYKVPMHEDRLKQIEVIAEFMHESSGFRIW